MSRRERKNSVLKWGAALSLSIVMALLVVPAQALAVDVDHEEDGVYLPMFSEPEEEPEPTEAIAASGEWGTCHWEIDVKGKLTVYPGEGEDTECFAPWNWYRTTITRVEFASNVFGDKVILPADSSYLFAHLDNVTYIDLANADTSRVQCMCSMFDGCPSLKNIDLSSFDTSSVTNMSWMFRGCSSLTSLDLSKFDTSSVTDMEAMFHLCSSLTTLDLSNFDTSNVTQMCWMFWGCSNLSTIYFSNFNTSNVERMNFMFRDCSSLTSLNLSNFDTSNVTNMSWMFQNCSSLTSLNISSFNTSNVTEMRETFRGCSSLTSLDLSKFDTSNVSNMNEMFRGCTELKNITVGRNWSTASIISGDNMFSNCNNLAGGNGTDFDPANASCEYACADSTRTPGYLTLKEESGYWGNSYWEFNTAGVLTVYSGWGDNTNGSCPWSDIANQITEVVFAADEDGFKAHLPSDSSHLFEGMDQLVSIDLSGAESTRVTNMGSMFRDCSSLTSLSLSGLDTSKVTGMDKMFSNCSSLESLDISGLNTSSVTDMTGMFEGCTSLGSLDLSSFDTSKVTGMSWMFEDCASLESLDLSNFETPALENMSVMFSGCSQLKTITVGKGWSTKGINDRSSDKVFLACTSLVGANGTTYDSNHMDSEYARVDAPGTPGYLTLKAAPAPAFRRANLTVGQQVGLTFWLELPQADGLDYRGAYAELSVDDKDRRTVELPLSEVQPSRADGLYGLTIDLTPVEMAEPVTATLHYKDGGEEKTADLTYSVRQYLEDFDAAAQKNPGAYTDKVVALVHATADLGHFMQPYLSAANGWAVGTDYESMDLSYREMGEDDVAAARQGVSGQRISGSVKGSGIKGVGASLSFGALTDVEVYLTPEDPGAKVTASASYGGRTFPAEKQADGRWLVRVEGIKPHDFGQTITVKGDGGTGEFAVNVSVLGVANVDLSGAADEVRDRAYAAAYYLWKAAQAI